MAQQLVASTHQNRRDHSGKIADLVGPVFCYKFFIVKRSYILFLISNYVMWKVEVRASNILITTLCRGNGRRLMDSISPSNCYSLPFLQRAYVYSLTPVPFTVVSVVMTTRRNLLARNLGWLTAQRGPQGSTTVGRWVGGWGEVLDFHDPNPQNFFP